MRPWIPRRYCRQREAGNGRSGAMYLIGRQDRARLAVAVDSNVGSGLYRVCPCRRRIGYVLSGGAGLQDFGRTAASLLQLVLLLVPLTALVFGVIALTPDIGAAELLFSQPVARGVVLLGKLLGLFVALVGAQTIGFGLAALVLFIRTGTDGAGASWACGWPPPCSRALSFDRGRGGGETSARRARGLASALVIWFAAVVLFDIAALGIASLLPPAPRQGR